MANSIQPGVYRQDSTIIGKPVTAATTATVAFVGNAGRGPVAEPVLISSFAEYQQQFQHPGQQPGQSDTEGPDEMTRAVMAYYGNGGKSAYICRITDDDYPWFFQNVLSSCHDVSLLVLPGHYWGAMASNVALSSALAFCQQVRRCMLLLDIAPGQQLNNAASVTALNLPVSSYAALYYPWLIMANPLYHATTNPLVAKTLTIAPSAVAAAVYARTDASHGVWKAPAGVSAKVMGVTGLQFTVENTSQQQLNPMGVNCIRSLPRVGTVLWGARTLAAQTDPEWRYISVRRTAIFLEQSICQSLQWTASEPNAQPLWQAVRRNVSNFLSTLYRAGAMQGASPKEAFFVRCDWGDTMTQHDIDQQQLVILLGFAPVKPAEFVLIRIVYKLSPP